MKIIHKRYVSFRETADGWDCYIKRPHGEYGMKVFLGQISEGYFKIEAERIREHFTLGIYISELKEIVEFMEERRESWK